MSRITEHHYNLKRLNVVFACASVALLAGILWLIKVDYDRPWRRYQNEYARVRRLLVAAVGEQEKVSDGSEAINAPLVDFLAPRGTPGKNEIKQVVLPDIRQDLHFVETYTTDRCMTCHVGIDDPLFSDRNLEKFKDKLPSPVDQPLVAHPDLNLYVAEDSPHPMKKMGCTVCHEGSGEETDFVLAAHTPSSTNVREQWKEKHYVRVAGLIPEHTFESAAEGWNQPMQLPKYTEANCARCHSKIADMAMHDWQPCATRINEGRLLFTSLGCVNCHEVKEFAGYSRCGPDLTHIANKLTKGFVHNWTWFPKDYLPSSNMPHSFLQENNDAFSAVVDVDSDPVLRTQAETVAVTEYLFAVSADFEFTRPPEDLWNLLKDEKSGPAKAAADRGRRLLGSVGCLGCHGVLSYQPDDIEFGGLLDPVGATWIAEDLAAKVLSTSQPAASEDEVWEQAYQQYARMSYVERIEYAMTHFHDSRDTIFDPDGVDGPVFSRYAPELSSIRAKFADYQGAVGWLYDWLKNPRHYSSDTRMPRLRLERGRFPVIDPRSHQPTGEMVDADEALDIAVYLSTLNENKTFSKEPFDNSDDKAGKLADQRDHLIGALLEKSDSATDAEVGDKKDDLKIADELVSRLSRFMDAKAAAGKVRSLNPDGQRWVWLGQRMIGHYGCYACHKIPGFETTTGPGPELTDWGDKHLSQLDFGDFVPGLQKRLADKHLYPQDRQQLIRWARTNPLTDVQQSRWSFAWHKVRNPRMWDRNKVKAPHDKLKMPNFFLSDEQADALVTFILSRKPSRVGKPLQVNYNNTPKGMIADGRNQARKLNCIGCHILDGNAALIQQYYRKAEGTELVFDEFNAPPWSRSEGARARGEWIYNYLRQVETVRPWLKVRMPSYHLNNDNVAQSLVEYFVGLCQDESGWLAGKLKSYQAHLQEPFNRQDDERLVDLLERYARVNRLKSSELPSIISEAELFRDLLEVSYPFTDQPLEPVPDDVVHDGEVLFYELRCLTCHIFGNPTVEGANPFPSAPNLQNVSGRLRREWVRQWLAKPSRFMPATTMPMHFGEKLEGAFVDYPSEDRAAVAAKLKDKSLLDDGAQQIEAIIAFIFKAGDQRLNKVQPSD